MGIWRHGIHGVCLGLFGDVDVGLHGFVVGMAGEFHHDLGRDAAGESHADAVQQTRFQINIAIFVEIILPVMNPMLKSKRILAAAVLFVSTAVMFFLPSVAIPHKIFIPLTVLALFSIKITPWTVTAGLAFSALGDLAGSFKTGGDPQ